LITRNYLTTTIHKKISKVNASLSVDERPSFQIQRYLDLHKFPHKYKFLSLKETPEKTFKKDYLSLPTTYLATVQ